MGPNLSKIKVARVAFASPLPQLDRLFDYEIPSELSANVFVGSLVIVNFGKGAKPKEGYVLEIVDNSNFVGDLATVQGVVSQRALLSETVVQLCRELSLRQALPLGELLKTAVPQVMSRIEKSAGERPAIGRTHESMNEKVDDLAPLREARTISAVFTADDRHEESEWVRDIVDSCSKSLKQGKSAIVCLPDFRDIRRVCKALEKAQLSQFLNRYDSDSTKSEHYARHIDALSGTVQIIVGSRSALFAPVQHLGLMYVWDEADSSHTDEGSPYLSSRDVALVRQKIEDCSLVFGYHSPSSAITRLVQIGYLQQRTVGKYRPKVAFSDDGFRVDSLAHKAIKEGLAHGPVLVQVSSTGSSTSISCSDCSTRSACVQCCGPLWESEEGRIQCRVCSSFNLNPVCASCGGLKIRKGRAGSARTLSEIGKSFPGVLLLEATGMHQNLEVDSSPRIVVATAGAEPEASGGYRAVIILDARNLLSRDQLDAQEHAVRLWANAISLMNSSGRAVLSSIPTSLGQRLSLWQLNEISRETLLDRSTHNFPPHRRVLSATGARDNLTVLREQLNEVSGVSVLGLAPVPNSSDSRLIATFDYSQALAVAQIMRKAVIEFGSSTRVTSSGRNQRPLTIKMDDQRVL